MHTINCKQSTAADDIGLKVISANEPLPGEHRSFFVFFPLHHLGHLFYGCV